ncbi:hypothetical protein [Sphingomonas xinjiangensis]|uniref:Multisubunit Na+/H+ antiporter MnhC subunit n=1 Tax=Sphingomonas xinjiangensis TaxID=643568 RepID=A0A840YJE2_9SPHN|nr:hypothetical protein [Sphingomonas xinjiangensis]MBB5708880.1 multisubunit Na+/H+ antiporter MnhC subunit [Sphingomonas xinjiangensis]
MPTTSDWNLWLVIALAMVAVGLLVVFLRRSKITAALSLGSSAAALAFIWLGTSRYSKAALLEQASRGRGGEASGLEHTAAAMISVNWHYGLWLAVGALIAAAAMAALVFSGKDVELAGPPR